MTLKIDGIGVMSIIEKCAVCAKEHKGLADVIMDIHCYTHTSQCRAPITEIKEYIQELANTDKDARDVKCQSCQGIFHPSIALDIKDPELSVAYDKLIKRMPYLEFIVPMDPFPLAKNHIKGCWRTSYFSANNQYKTEDLLPLCSEHFCTYREYLKMMEGKSDNCCPCKKKLVVAYVMQFKDLWVKLLGMNKSLSEI